ncbi:MAG TPA: M15 family metallopeptidase [Allosphingosinicella sp.]|nr:M15 family metallopeptidase [Allosphingosinicella sp.]
MTSDRPDLQSAFGSLAPLRERPVPPQAEALALKRGYRAHPLDPTSAAGAEALVDIRSFGLRGENFYASRRNPPHYAPIPGSVAGLWVREGVAERLAGVDRRLGEEGLGLWLFDAWRPDRVQAYFHDVWMPAELRRRRPGLDEDRLRAEVSSYWSAPTTDRASPAPHLTGGAVDLSICWVDTAERLWMGSIFDDVSAIAHVDHFERNRSGDRLALSDDEARSNRRLLYWLMVEAGFCSNPTEWWHYSHGDQMWARLTGAEAALYGAAAAPTR